MSADSEEILDDAVHRCKTLQMGSRLEPAHLAFPLAGRLMRDFRAIVFILPGTVDHGRHDGTVRGRVTAQLVRDQPARLAALSFQQLAEEPLGRPLIAPRLHEDVKDVAVFVDSTPQILLPALDLDEQLVQMPGAALATLGRARNVPEATSFKMALSSAWSATSRFSRAFSCSRVFSRFAWSRRKRPYSLRQR